MIKMKFKIIYLIILLFSLLSCSKSQNNHKDYYDGPIDGGDDIDGYYYDTTVEDINALFKNFVSRDEKKLDLESVLSAIHPFLKVGKGLKPITIGTESVLELNITSFRFFRDVTKSLYSPYNSTGYAMLHMDFWDEMFELYKRGFRIGFIENDPKKHNNKTVGAFYPSLKMIVLSKYADHSTLRHELRHYLQVITDLPKTNSSNPYSSLDPACEEKLISYFNELDAVLYAASKWEHIMNIYYFDEEGRHFDFEYDFGGILDSARALMDNFDYKKHNEMRIISENSCPESIKETIIGLTDSLSDLDKLVKDIIYDAGVIKYHLTLNNDDSKRTVAELLKKHDGSLENLKADFRVDVSISRDLKQLAVTEFFKDKKLTDLKEYLSSKSPGFFLLLNEEYTAYK